MGPAPKRVKRQIKDEDDTTNNGYTSDSNHGSSETSGTRSQHAKVNRKMLNKNSLEYKERRKRNNEAVKKSRKKSKTKTMETLKRVNELKEENLKLTQNIEILSKELTLLKELFRAHVTGAHGGDIDEEKLSGMISEETFRDLMGS